MSPRTLQHVVVRLLHDDAFVEALRTDARDALAAEDLSEAERTWIAAVDPRAWRTDPLRGDRLVTSMIEEFPAATCIACRTGGGIDRLRAFVRSRAFHACVSERGSLAAAFHRHLDEAFTDAREHPVRALAALEGAIARVRRATAPLDTLRGAPAPTDALVLSPRVAVPTLPAGTLASYRAVTAALHARAGADGPAAVALDPTWRPPPLPALAPSTHEPVLVDGTAGTSGGIGVTPIGEALAGLLGAAATGADRAALEARAVALGAEPDEAPEVVAGLEADGLIVSHRPPLARNPPKPYVGASIEGPPS